MYAGQVDWAIVDAVQRIAAAHGVSAAKVGLAWLLAKPAVTAPIVGATKLAQLDEALGALDVELSADEIAELERPYRPHWVLGH